MSRYKVKINVELVECDEAVNDTPTEQQDGSFSMVISEKDAVSIDKCEKTILKTAYPTIRSALSEHLTGLSKKKAREISEAGGQVMGLVLSSANKYTTAISCASKVTESITYPHGRKSFERNGRS